MLFRRMIFSALIIGAISGLLLSATQILSVNPIILHAETFEGMDSSDADHAHDDSVGEHSHDAVTQQLDDVQIAEADNRGLFSIYANISAGIGFAAVLLALMSQMQIQGLTRLTPARGVLWGAAGFIAFFAAPAIGLPPEIPGVQAAPLEQRQLWWFIAVVGVGLGLLIINFAPLRYKIIGVITIVFPYLINIPHQEGPEFAQTDPAAVEILTGLHQKFIIVSSLNNLLFWLVLGACSAWLLNFWIHKERSGDANAHL